jgi:sterol desaturase/sphingolipid hydroxylase (fatty acid hydroxylase superfamily)
MKKVVSEILNKEKVVNFIVNETIGRFVGFVVGMWSSSLFTKVVYEKRGLNNLFGMMPRKKVVVNTTPEWVQLLLSIIVGFIMLELVNYFFKNKLYLPIWENAKMQWVKQFGEKKESL